MRQRSLRVGRNDLCSLGERAPARRATEVSSHYVSLLITPETSRRSQTSGPLCAAQAQWAADYIFCRPVCGELLILGKSVIRHTQAVV